MRGAPARRCYLREEQTTVTDSRHYWQRGKFYGVRKITVLILKFSKDSSQAKSEIGREEEKVKVSPLIFYSRLSPGYRGRLLWICRSAAFQIPRRSPPSWKRSRASISRISLWKAARSTPWQFLLPAGLSCFPLYRGRPARQPGTKSYPRDISNIQSRRLQ